MADDFDKRLLEIAEDNQSGSRIITARASTLFRRLIDDPEVDRPEIINRLRRACRRLERAHSELYAVRTFCDSVIMILDAAPPEKELHKRLISLLDSFSDVYSERLSLEIATHIYPVFRESSAVFTHSHSSTVHTVLEHIGKKIHSQTIFQTASYPVKEGVTMARMLNEAGFRVQLIADAGMATAIENCDLVLLGADGINKEHFFNKQGSRAIAICASYYGVPLYVLADSSKLIRDNEPVTIEPKDPDELAEIDADGIDVQNFYFDATPLGLATGYILESGSFTPQGMLDLLSEPEEDTDEEKNSDETAE